MLITGYETLDVRMEVTLDHPLADLYLTESDRAWLIAHLKSEADKIGDVPRSTRIRRILRIWGIQTQPSKYESGSMS